MNVRVEQYVVWFLLLWAVVSGKSTYVEEACSVTRYHHLCVRSLGSFSDVARRSPSKWARAGVSVTIGELKGLLRYLVRLNKYGRWKGRSHVALLDCIELVQDSLDNLHQSLDVLRKLNAGEFEGQMSDVLTWMSTALTDEDTCIEGLDKGRGVKRRVTHATYITSNALALANKLATSGVAANDP